MRRHQHNYILLESSGAMEYSVEVFLENKTHEMVVEAEDQRQALQQARDRIGDGVVLKVKPVGKELSLDALKFWERVGLNDLEVFCESLATFLRAGLPVVTSLEILTGQEENRRLQASLQAVVDSVKAGLPLADAFRSHGAVFPSVFCDSIEVAEESGKLVENLEQLAEHFRQENEMRGRVNRSMIYPAAVFVLGILVAAFLVVFVLPVFTDMLQDMGGEMPLPTRVLIWISNHAPHLVSILFLVLLATLLTFRRLNNYRDFRVKWERFLLGIPMFGKLLRLATALRLLRSMSLMLQAGVSILGAIELMEKTAPRQTLKEELQEARNTVWRGDRFTGPLDSSLWLDFKTVKLLEVGEETGELDGMMLKAADYLNIEINRVLDRLPTVLEVLLISSLALGVGFLILAIVLPMLEIYGEII